MTGARLGAASHSAYLQLMVSRPDRDGALAPEAEPSGRAALRLAAVAALCLVAAGGLLWWRNGEAVFASLVTAALAWCF